MPSDLARCELGYEPNLSLLTENLNKRHLDYLEQTNQEGKIRSLYEKLDEALLKSLATKLATDILTGQVQTFNPNGSPFHSSSDHPLPIGDKAPHLTVALGNEWLRSSGFNWIWSPITVNKRQAENRDRYNRAYAVGFRFGAHPNARLAGVGRAAKLLGLDRQTLANSLKEFKRDHPDEI
jgi:hypothetical protein